MARLPRLAWMALFNLRIEMAFTRPNRSGKTTPNDVVHTPAQAARWIVNRYAPKGLCLEPCRGGDAFWRELPEPKEWCEIEQGRDFLAWNGRADWIITNPPFSIYDLFLSKAFECADNIVFLTPLQKVFKSRKMDDKLTAYGGIKEIVMMGGGGCLGFPFGFPCGCIYFKRGYSGPTDIVRAYNWLNSVIKPTSEKA